MNTVKSDTPRSQSKQKLQNSGKGFAIVQKSLISSDVYIILDFCVLSSVTCEPVSCKICDGHVKLIEDSNARVRLACLLVSCDKCGSKNTFGILISAKKLCMYAMLDYFMDCNV